MTTKSNRYAGPCGRCGARVQAAAGTYSGGVCWHAEGECNTTTKTYRKITQAKTHQAGIDSVTAIWAAHGMRRPDLLNATASAPMALAAYKGGWRFSWAPGTPTVGHAHVQGRNDIFEFPIERNAERNPDFWQEQRDQAEQVASAIDAFLAGRS